MIQSTKCVLLIDAMAMAYRAFYAIRDLSTPDGRPTNALYGFIRMTQQLQRQWNPTHWAVVFDCGLPEERMAILDTYKAQREPMPEALEKQLDPINEYLDLTGVPRVIQERQEADDLLATLAVRARTEGARVLIATSDKDLFQMVDDSIQLVSPTKSEERMGIEEVVLKTGVRPEAIAEWLALIGDTADNIPGVPGVGPKTAAKLLNEFGSIEAIYNRLDQVSSEKLRAALQTHRDVVFRNIRMTTLRTDLDCVPDWIAWEVRRPIGAGLLSFYRDMHFNTLAREVESPTLFD